MPRSGVRTAAVLLAMPSLAWLLALLSVNSDTLLCHYLFAASNCLQVSGGPPKRIPGTPKTPPRTKHTPGTPKTQIPGAPKTHIPGTPKTHT